MKTIKLVTDGACSQNGTQKGGWAYKLTYVTPSGRLVNLEGSASQEDTTNQQMELVATTEGLRALVEPCKETIYTDSMYVIGLLEKGWKAKKNIELVTELRRIAAIHEVSCIHVKGHSGDIDNEYINEMAQKEAGTWK